MTKAEEMSLLGKIAELIASAGTDSYIHDTFNGVVEVCRRNIEDDFGDRPVEDLEREIEMRAAEIRAHEETKRMLYEARDMCKEAMDENERLRKLVAEWEHNAHDAGDLYCELEEECRAKSQEITRLRAEIVRMRLEKMTEFDLANLYEKTEAN